MNIDILPSVNFAKQKRVAKPGISVCSRITRLMNNQTKSQRKATVPTKEEKATTRMLCQVWKLYHIWCASRKTRKHWLLKEESSPGKPDAKSLGTDSKITIHSVYATSSKYPRKQRSIAEQNTSQTSSSARSLRCEIWGQISGGDWKTIAMRQLRRVETCKEYL